MNPDKLDPRKDKDIIIPRALFATNEETFSTDIVKLEQFYSKNYSGVNLLNPDFVMLAKACGMDSCYVDNTEDLKKAIQVAHDHKGPYLIHAYVMKEENVLPMVAPGTSLSETIYYPAKAQAEKVTK